MATTADTAAFVIAKVEAQRSATLIQVGALLGAALCIALAAALQSPINTQRRELELVTHSNIYKELPPEYAWVSVVGPFRGLAADFLWMRADKLKEEGKYYEAHQLAKWICTLYPRFPAVWSFQAWNMSYNISVATHTALERWQWVYNGIRLLRDEGIPNNERIVPLYHQLAWTWFHKVGDRMDDWHWAYKRTWASTMETLLGAPPEGRSDAETIDWFRPVAEAPTQLDVLIGSRPGVRAVVDKLKDLGIDVEDGTGSQRIFHPLEEKLFRPYTLWQQEKQLAGLRAKRAELTPEQQKLGETLDGLDSEDLNALLAYLRAKVLREQYKMDPEFMLKLTGMLGTDEPLPIDWRTPWSQSMYWALYGTTRGSELKNVKEFDLLNTDRIMLFSLANLAKVGRFVFRMDPQDPMESFLNMLPDLRYIEAMHRKYIEMGKKHAEEGEQVGETAGETLRSGHVNNLHEAIVALYMAGKEGEARRYLTYLAQNYKEMYTNITQEQYLQSVDTFVQTQIKDMIESFNTASYLIYSLLSKGYLALAAGSADEFATAIDRAQMVYNIYQKDKIDDFGGRRALPPFPRIRSDALSSFMLTFEYPLPIRSMIWNREQIPIRQQSYDFVIPYLTEECRREGFDVEKAFPEPPGMEAYRVANPRPLQADQVAKERQDEKLREQKK